MNARVEGLPVPSFTPRQRDILLLTALGYNRGEVERQVGTSHNTFGVESRTINASLGVSDLNSATVISMDLGIVPMQAVLERYASVFSANREEISSKQHKVLAALLSSPGATNEELGIAQSLSWQTVKNHLVAASSKLGITGREQLLAVAYVARFAEIDLTLPGKVEDEQKIRKLITDLEEGRQVQQLFSEPSEPVNFILFPTPEQLPRVREILQHGGMAVTFVLDSLSARRDHNSEIIYAVGLSRVAIAAQLMSHAVSEVDLPRYYVSESHHPYFDLAHLLFEYDNIPESQRTLVYNGSRWRVKLVDQAQLSAISASSELQK